MLNEALQTFSQVVLVPAYISTIISAAADLEAIASSADEDPGEMMCFPAGLHYLSLSQQDCPKYHRNRCVFMRTFPRKDVFHVYSKEPSQRNACVFF